jgi:hypothetical protein
MKWIIIFFLMTSCLKSQVRYELECDQELLKKSEEIARNQVGVLEKSNRNDGKRITEYLRSVGINSPAPYCAAGVYYCFCEAKDEVGGSIPIVRSGVASKIYNEAKTGKRSRYSPKRHDLIVWKRNKSWQGHIERIVEVGRRGWVTTVAFNVRKGNKEGVFYKRRNVFHPLGRLRILGLVGLRERKKQ